MVVVHQSGGNQGGVKKCPLWVDAVEKGVVIIGVP
jgi:hypothetical protein